MGLLTLNPYEHNSLQTKDKIKKTIDFVRLDLSLPLTLVLDVGRRSPMTEALEKEFGIEIDNTTGDLDVGFTTPKKEYDAIIYSHTIEHQFNPLFTLLELRKLMNPQSWMYIFLPRRGKLLWTKYHYHEIDEYRMGLLLERAGFKIVHYEKHKVKRPLVSYLMGIRPLLRLFFEYNAAYIVKRDDG